jgi:ATP-binding cassette subfamily B protein
MPKQKKKIHSGAIFALFWKHTKRYPWLFALTIVGGLVSQAGDVISPLYIKQLFNLLNVPDASLSALSAPILAYLGVRIIGWFGGRMEMWFGYTTISRVTENLTNEAFANLMRHSYQFFSSSFSGALTRKVGRFAGAYENLFYSVETVLFQAFLYVGGIVGVLFYLNWVLGAVVLAWVAAFIAIQWWLSKFQQPLRVKRAEEDSNVTATLADAISNQNTVALFSGNRYEEGFIGKAAHAYQKAQERSWNTNTVIYGFQGLLTIGLNIGMLWLGIVYWKAGVLTLGDLVLIQAYVFGLFEYVWNLGRQFQLIHNSFADASEMIDIMQTPLGVQDTVGASAIRVEKGDIAFRNVSFNFQEDVAILGGLNLQIEGGRKVAFVGPSGAGKSTITKLLLRLYDVQGGSIEIDGQNIARVTQDSLRDAIAFVPQEPILFHRTLMENIRYGRRGASDEAVIEAAKKAHCHEFISKLPQGYDTFVGERGIKLSGGERQRVAIARAILKDAPILVLDEATSSLDSESEALIQDALEVLMRGKTVIVIAHRLSTIMKMDRIVVLEGGKVVADGTHEELLAQKGLYHKLWSIQAGGFIGVPDETNPNSLVDEDAEDAPEEEDLAKEQNVA